VSKNKKKEKGGRTMRQIVASFSEVSKEPGKTEDSKERVAGEHCRGR